MNKNKISFKNLKGARLAFAIIGSILMGVGFFLFLIPFFFVFVLQDFEGGMGSFAMPFFGIVTIIIGNVFLTVAKKNTFDFINQGNNTPNQIDDDNAIYHPSRNPNVERIVSCPSCKKFVDATSSFCPECGSRLNKFCKYCGNENEAGSSYCSECGRKLEE